MTVAHPVARRSPDRIGVCGARRGTLLQREKVTDRALDRLLGSKKRGDPYAACRIRPGLALDPIFATLLVTASGHPVNLGLHDAWTCLTCFPYG